MAFQSIVPVKLGQAAISATPTVTTVYTVPASTRTLLKDIDIANTTAGAITVRVYIVPSAGSPATSNALFYGVSIAANTTLQWTGTQIMTASETLQAEASATGLTIRASGAEAV